MHDPDLRPGPGPCPVPQELARLAARRSRRRPVLVFPCCTVGAGSRPRVRRCRPMACGSGGTGRRRTLLPGCAASRAARSWVPRRYSATLTSPRSTTWSLSTSAWSTTGGGRTLRWSRIRALPSRVAEERLRPFMHQVVDLEDADFEILLRAAVWFTENPRSGLTIRQVPVPGMGTKWLARNRRLVLACLNITEQSRAPAPDEELEQGDLDPLGLKALPVHVDVILADPADRALVGGLRHLRAPLPEVAALPVRPEITLIVENKESAYLVPDRPRTVVIHSLGNHLNILGEIGWLDGAHHLYWGDLDRAGFTLLSRARAQLPRLVSVLMDPATLEEHRTLAVQDETRADAPDPNLTDSEVHRPGRTICRARHLPAPGAGTSAIAIHSQSARPRHGGLTVPIRCSSTRRSRQRCLHPETAQTNEMSRASRGIQVRRGTGWSATTQALKPLG